MLRSTVDDRLNQTALIASVCAALTWIIWVLGHSVSSPSSTPPVLLVIWSVLVVPMVEEIFLRAIVQRGLLLRAWGRRRALGFSVANVTAAMALALIYFGITTAIHAAAMATVGLIFGLIYEKTRSVRLCVVVHMVGGATWWVLTS